MGEPILELSSSANWEQVYNETKSATYLNRTDFMAIPAFTLPFILNSPYIVVEASNINAKPWWFLGCRLQQVISVGIAPNAVATDLWRVPVNRPMLIRFPRLVEDYLLKIEIPPWFDRMKIAVHAYTGTIKDSTEELIIERSDVIRVDLTRIEAKIDAL